MSAHDVVETDKPEEDIVAAEVEDPTSKKSESIHEIASVEEKPDDYVSELESTEVVVEEASAQHEGSIVLDEGEVKEPIQLEIDVVDSEDIDFAKHAEKLEKEISAVEMNIEEEEAKKSPETKEKEDEVPSAAEEGTEMEVGKVYIVPDQEVSHISLHGEELPEIRGLAELEYESGEDSLKEVTFDDMYLSKRKSVRPSLAAKMFTESFEEISEKKKVKVRREVLGKGAKVSTVKESFMKEDKPTVLSREEYYSLHERISSDYSFLKMKNKFLQRKMADNFRKRKMEHVLREEFDIQTEALQKYDKKLDRLADLLELYSAETTRIGAELHTLQQQQDAKNLERKTIFMKGISREREIGTGLISTKTGKEIPDKVVEQLLRRQINAANQISELRLKFITKRDELVEKTAELKSLDNIGEDLSLMDYEQLKIENRAHSDKLEEREEELTKLRIKCRNAVQVMAHVREKAAALDADMDILKEEYEEVHAEYIEIRERLNFYKTERDIIRNKTMKLKAESGLLTKPKLLFDMETSMEELKVYEKHLERVKEEYMLKTQQIRNLRKNIAYEMLMNKKQHKEKKQVPVAKFFPIRPSLFMPKIPKDVFDKLKLKINELSNEE
ncbi:hypothetical protein HHI36_014323 [Cryptolaemus montrouzieri]|uniref:CCDC113/CCDC96 coiled-coil domain-containing protein n=1 Tax=Cryptolaemus montrouzieri TaxID=559131 RepID=A0ABD2N368_9CUCU